MTAEKSGKKTYFQGGYFQVLLFLLSFPCFKNIFDCCKQSLTPLSLPSIYPSIHPSIHLPIQQAF
jgi:hypothetical protein